MDFSFKVNKKLKKCESETFLQKYVCVQIKLQVRRKKSGKKKTINTAFASQQVLLKNRVSDF